MAGGSQDLAVAATVSLGVAATVSLPLVHACSPLCNLSCNFKQRKPFQPHDFKGLLPRLKRARYPLCGQFASSSLCVYSPSWSSFCCADPSLKRDLLVFVGIQRCWHSAVWSAGDSAVQWFSGAVLATKRLVLATQVCMAGGVHGWRLRCAWLAIQRCKPHLILLPLDLSDAMCTLGNFISF